MQSFGSILFGAASKLLQTQHGSRAQYERLAAQGSRNGGLGEFERAFIAARDSFYLATVTEDGWPYVQHRGGPAGFLHVPAPDALAFADYAGNRQYITAGNLATNDRVALFLMSYPERARLKIVGHARIAEPGAEPELERALQPYAAGARVERVVVIRIAAFDWNCSQHITPRWSEAELRAGAATGD